MNIQRKLLKSDTFGSIYKVTAGSRVYIERDMSAARPWARWLARALARREARALGRLGGRDGYPALRSLDAGQLTRSFVPGEPMYVARPADADYFRSALRHLRVMHRCGVTHNDLAKEPNWLVRPGGDAAIVDFQLASVFRRRGRWFRLLAREDLRHYLKHKRTYRPQALTQRDRRILATPAITTRIWRRTAKPLYLFVTRRLLHWSDREGAGDRGRR